VSNPHAGRSGTAADPDRLLPGATWQVTAIGRDNIWPLHRRTAELGGNLRNGLEDTFYLPDGSKATSNGQLVDAIVRIARTAAASVRRPPRPVHCCTSPRYCAARALEADDDRREDSRRAAVPARRVPAALARADFTRDVAAPTFADMPAYATNSRLAAVRTVSIAPKSGLTSCSTRRQTLHRRVVGQGAADGRRGPGAETYADTGGHVGSLMRRAR
jgi:hypothetical protein